MSWTTILDISPNGKVVGRNRLLWGRDCEDGKKQ